MYEIHRKDKLLKFLNSMKSSHKENKILSSTEMSWLTSKRRVAQMLFQKMQVFDLHGRG